MSVQVKDKKAEVKAPAPSNVCSGWCTTFAEAALYSLIDTKIPSPQLFTICKDPWTGKPYYCYEAGKVKYELGKLVEGDKTRILLYKKVETEGGTLDTKFGVHIILDNNNKVEKILLVRVGVGLYFPEYVVAELLPKEGKLKLVYEYWTKIRRKKELVAKEKEFNANDTCILTPCRPEEMPSWAQRPIRIRDITEKLIQVARVALAVYGIPAKL
jgi:hypothetical protein